MGSDRGDPEAPGDRAGAEPATPRRSFGELLALFALLLGAGLLLHVPTARVPLYYDMIGYAAQAESLLSGHLGTMSMGNSRVPTVYPMGLPVLAAAAMALTGPDLRHALLAVFACALLALLCVHLCVRRAGLSPWAGAAALLFVLCSPLFRTMSGFVLSQVPTATAVALLLWLFLQRRSGSALFLAGLLAMLALLLRYANVTLPVALVGAELLFGGVREGSRRRSLALLGGGLLLGAVVVLAHNVVFNGGAFLTAYNSWGWHVEEQFALSNVFSPPDAGSGLGKDTLTGALLGFSDLHSIPMALAAAWGLRCCWREGRGSAARRPAREAWLLGGFALCLYGASCLLLAGLPFRRDSYLIPTVPVTAALAAWGCTSALQALGGLRLARLAPLLATGLLVMSIARMPPPDSEVEASIARIATLEQADALLERNAALITPTDPCLVDPFFRRQPGRLVLYIQGGWPAKLMEDRALEVLGAQHLTAQSVVNWAFARLREGHPVYVDQNPPSRGLLALHVAIRTALRANFTLEPVGIDKLYRLQPRQGDGSPRVAPAHSDGDADREAGGKAGGVPGDAAPPR